jgi:hypothetical protein
MYLGEVGSKLTFWNVSTISGWRSVSADEYGEFGILVVFTRRTSIVNVPYPFGSATSAAVLTSLIPTLTSVLTDVPCEIV